MAAGLRQLPVADLENRDFAHGVDVLPPGVGARHTADEIRERHVDGSPGLAQRLQQHRDLVGVAGLGEAVELVHRVPCWLVQ